MSIVVVLVLLALALYYAWRAPEVAVCEHCLHIVQRSKDAPERWFHKDSGSRKCWPYSEDSPHAEPHPYAVL